MGFVQRCAVAGRSILMVAAAGLALSACAPMYSATGVLLSGYAKDNVVPYVQASKDTDLATCGTALGQSQLLGSFSRVMDDPDYLMFYNSLLAGYCADGYAAEANLRYLRASQSGNVEEATDARIAEKRWHAVAARRRYTAYRHLVETYGRPGVGGCPDLDDESDQSTYLIGLVTVLQAVQSDLLSGSQVGIPRDLAVNAGRAAKCLDNDRWWGVPDAVQATVWSFVPGTTPEGKTPWQVFHKSAAQAKASGMRLALALYGIAAENQGRTDELQRAIAAAAAIRGDQAPSEYVLVDRLAVAQLRHLSDKLWTEAEGHRTPIDGLGQFPGESSSPKPDTKGLL